MLASIRATMPSHHTTSFSTYSTLPHKKLGITYLLWFLLGWLGAHRFYVGRSGSGVSMAFLTVLTVALSKVPFIGFLFAVPLALYWAVWWLVDGLFLTTWPELKPSTTIKAVNPQFAKAKEEAVDVEFKEL